MTYDKLDAIMTVCQGWPALRQPDEWPVILAEYVNENYPMERPSDGIRIGFPHDKYGYADALARCLAIILDTPEKVADFDKWCQNRIADMRTP